ncbi:MAG: hypothetical protein FJ137_15020, partial [Deltaproteobacteria bacterium]|nr:hypothetical protein [Deltaproteobacteria bacterium]
MTPCARLCFVAAALMLCAALPLAGVAACTLPADAAYGRACDADVDCGGDYVCERAVCVPFTGFLSGEGEGEGEG